MKEDEKTHKHFSDIEADEIDWKKLSNISYTSRPPLPCMSMHIVHKTPLLSKKESTT